MSPQEVVEHVKRKDWDVARPGLYGPETAPALLPLLDSPDTQVRQLTVKCLAAAGGPEVKPALLRALDDKHEMVRATAVQLLPPLVDHSDLPTLQRQLHYGHDEYVREQIALIIGRLGDPEAAASLAAQQQQEKDAHARHAMLLARVRLGDATGRHEFLSQLASPEIPTRVQSLKSLDYLGDRSLVPYVLPLLDDTRTAEKSGPSHSHYYIRVCDVAINALDPMLGHPFPFEVRIAYRYSDAELAQAKSLLAAIK